MERSVLRIIDANLNRATEGLRLLEEHARLGLEDAALTAEAKRLRHALAEIGSGFGSAALLSARDIAHDVGTKITTASEQTRSTGQEVAVAASKRAAESIRCIEEYGKILDPAVAGRTECLRYALYELEQNILLAGPARATLAKARLHVIVTEALCSGPWLTVCGQAVSGGADVLQLREKRLSDRELLDRARRLRDLTREHGVLLVVNDRPDVARLAAADGLHVGQSDLPLGDARSIAGPGVLVGVSTHTVDEARSALLQRPDYLAVGLMFPSTTKPGLEAKGTQLLGSIAPEADVPVVAIGGVTPDNVAQVLDTCKGVQIAACQAVIGAADPAAAARALKDQLPAGEIPDD